MTLRATCPQGHTLTVEDKLAGKKIRCPRCKTVFQVPDLDDDDDEDEDEDDDDDDDEDESPRGKKRPPARASDDDDEDDEEEVMDEATRRKLERKEKKKALKLVDVGLLLHYIKLYMYVIGIIFGVAALIFFVIATSRHTADVADAGGKQVDAVAPGEGIELMGFAIMAILMFLLYLFVSLIGPLLGIVGSFLCCWVPKKSHARGVIIISLTFDLVAIICWLLRLLAVVGAFGMEIDKTLRMISLLNYISYFCLIASWLTFLTFLRSLGAYLGEPGVGNEALNLIARLVVQVISLIGNLMANVASAIFFGGIVGVLVGLAFILVWFVFFVFGFFLRLIKLIAAMRRAVQNRI